MTDPILLREDANAVATLTLNRPEALNALSDAMLAELKAAFAALADDRSVKAVILKGVGATKGARAAIEAAGGKVED